MVYYDHGVTPRSVLNAMTSRRALRCTPSSWRSSRWLDGCQPTGWRSLTTRPKRLPSGRDTARAPLSMACLAAFWGTRHVLAGGHSSPRRRISGRPLPGLPGTPREMDTHGRLHRLHHRRPDHGRLGRQVCGRPGRGRPPACPQLSRHGVEGGGRRAGVRSAPCPVPPSFGGGTSDHALEAHFRIQKPKDVLLRSPRCSACLVVHVCT